MLPNLLCSTVAFSYIIIVIKLDILSPLTFVIFLLLLVPLHELLSLPFLFFFVQAIPLPLWFLRREIAPMRRGGRQTSHWWSQRWSSEKAQNIYGLFSMNCSTCTTQCSRQTSIIRNLQDTLHSYQH